MTTIVVICVVEDKVPLDARSIRRYSGAMKSRMFFVLLLVWGGPLVAAPTAATVQVKAASLYSSPSSVSKFLGKLPLGTSLTVLEEKNGWGRVQSTLGQGWLRTQAYSAAKSNLRSTGAGAADVSSTEVSLAGRGFSEEVEASYKNNNPQLDFSLLDQMEEQGLDPNELTAFLRDGGLKPREVD